MAELWIPASVDIDSRLVKRFTLADNPQVQNPYWLERVILPVTQVDELLKSYNIESVPKDLSAAAGTYVAFHTVPDGKRWVVQTFFKAITTAVSMVRIYDGTTYLTLLPNQTGAHTEFNCELPLKEGWSIGLTTTGDGGDANRALAILYSEEDAY